MVLRYITDGKDVFGQESENSVWLCVINRSDSPQSYTVDCRCAGMESYTGTAAPLSGEIFRIQ
jgi:hypothetical protein